MNLHLLRTRWSLTMGFFVLASCGGVGDVCSATASDFAGTYTVLIDDAVKCYCGEVVGMPGDCPTRCADAIAAGATCTAEATYCSYYRREAQSATFTIESDGTVKVMSLRSGQLEEVAADCDVNITSFCDFSFSCVTGEGPITATWKKVD